MRNPLSRKIVEIQPSGIRKFFDVANEMEDAISLGVGEPDFDTPWRIREEGMFSLEKGRTFYTSNAGLKELRKEICNYLERKIHVKYDAVHETLVTVGGSEAIDVGLRCMLDPGDEVLIPQPSYVSYLPCTVMADGVPVIIPLQEKNEFKLTAEELEKYTTPKTKVLVLPFPNNPTGAIMTREDLEPIAKFVEEHDLYVMSDEIYSELTYKEEHVSIASLPGMRERTLVINGFSKGFAMTGWRLGYCCGPEVIISQMTKLHQFAIMCAPTNSQYAAVQGLRNCGDEVEEMRKSYNQRRRFLMHEFKKMGRERFPESIRSQSDSKIAGQIMNALERGIKMQRRDRSFAKASYSGKSGTISWFMPLHIDAPLSEDPELVMVVRRSGDFYEIKTILSYDDELKDRITALSLYSKLW